MNFLAPAVQEYTICENTHIGMPGAENRLHSQHMPTSLSCHKTTVCAQPQSTVPLSTHLVPIVTSPSLQQTATVQTFLGMEHRRSRPNENFQACSNSDLTKTTIRTDQQLTTPHASNFNAQPRTFTDDTTNSLPTKWTDRRLISRPPKEASEHQDTYIDSLAQMRANGGPELQNSDFHGTIYGITHSVAENIAGRQPQVAISRFDEHPDREATSTAQSVPHSCRLSTVCGDPATKKFTLPMHTQPRTEVSTFHTNHDQCWQVNWLCS
jgi:hypothetical protein